MIMENSLIYTYNIDETLKLGKSFAGTLSAFPLIIGLTGDLGAGKTSFIRGFASHFKVKEEVHSPSYTLVNQYSGDVKIYHSDFYRLSSADDVFYLDLFENIGRNSVILIEWVDKFGDTFYEKLDYYITIKVIDFKKREIKINKLK